MPYLRTAIMHAIEREPGLQLRTKAGQSIEAATLGEAIAAAAAILRVRIVPHDPPKWFRLSGVPGREKYMLVDIHVFRGNENICPKQDLTFPLLDSDVVGIGALAC